jgi:hypothetical protein
MADDQVYSVTIPPPVMGINTKQPISEMDPLYTPEAENFITNGSTVDLRKGCAAFSTVGDSGDTFQGLAPYAMTSGTKYLIAYLYDASGSGVFPYSITTGGTAADISGGTALTAVDISPIFSCNFNGRVFMKAYDDTTDVYVWTGTGNISAAAFTGPSSDDKALRQISAYKNRLYFCGADAKVWYGTVEGVTGALTSFDFAKNFTNGGQLLYCGSISPNPSNDRDQNFIAISTSGDVLMYQGDYPGSSAWSIAGSYFAGEPIGLRSFIQFQNDILVITKQGLVSILALVSGTALENSYLSDNIGTLFTDNITSAASLANPNYISGAYHPTGNYILINFPTATDLSTYKQLVFYTLNKSWWVFTGYGSPRMWASFNGGLYFTAGTSAKVQQADTGYLDTSSSDGSALSRTIVLRHAYNYFSAPNKTKQFLEARPVMFQSEGFALTADMDVDYGDVTATQVVTPNTADTAYKIYRPRIGLKGIGRAGSFRIDGTVTTKRMSLQATEISWKEGGNV